MAAMFRGAHHLSMVFGLRMFLSAVLGVLVVVLVLEANEESSNPKQIHRAIIFKDKAVEGGSQAAQHKLRSLVPETVAPTRSSTPSPEPLPDFVHHAPGDYHNLNLFGAYFKEGNKIVFSGQCFDQHKPPDFCAIYLKDKPSQCAKMGKPLFVSAEIVECDFGSDYWCSSTPDRPLVAAVGMKGQSVSSIEVEDYRNSAPSARHTLSMCTIFKIQSSNKDLNSLRFLEWLAYHELVGVEHFYLYDHRSPKELIDPLVDTVLSYYIQQGKLTLKRVEFNKKCSTGETSTESTHEWAFSDCIARYAGVDEWMLFQDSDEFVYPGDNATDIKEVLAQYRSRENIWAIVLPWIMIGTSGHKKRPPGIIMENYVHREPPRCFTGRENYYDNFCTGKLLGRLDRMGYLLFPHLLDYDISHKNFGAGRNPPWYAMPDLIKTDRSRLLFNRPEPTNKFCDEGAPCMWTPNPPEAGLNMWHYYTQSEEDYREKIDRGCVTGCRYSEKTMKDHDNAATIKDERMKERFSEKVKERIDSLRAMIAASESLPNTAGSALQ